MASRRIVVSLSEPTGERAQVSYAVSPGNSAVVNIGDGRQEVRDRGASEPAQDIGL